MKKYIQPSMEIESVEVRKMITLSNLLHDEQPKDDDDENNFVQEINPWDIDW